MKTTAVVVALLASVAIAQPHHGRHAHQKKDLGKRKYEITWVTETKWATLIIDDNGTTLQEPSPAQFYPSTTSEETTSTKSSSESSPTSESTTTQESIPSSTSTPPEPTPSTEAASKEDDPTTSLVPVYSPTTAEISVPTSDSSSGSSGGGSSYTGDMTFYDPSGTGACGRNLLGMKPSGTSPSDPAIVALAFGRFVTSTTGGNSNNDPVCGKIIKFTIDGKTGYGRIEDKCEGCSYDDIDINPEAFSGLCSLDRGRVQGVQWEYV